MLRTEGIILDLSDQPTSCCWRCTPPHLHERRQQPTMAMPRYLRAKINNRLCISRCRAKVQHAGVSKLDTPAKEGDVCTMM